MTTGLQYALSETWPSFYTSKSADGIGKFRPEQAPIITPAEVAGITDLAAVINGVGTMSESLRVTQHLAGTFNGVGTEAATLRTKQDLACLIAGIGTETAALRTTQHLSDAIAGVGTLSDALRVTQHLSSGIAGVGTLTADLDVPAVMIDLAAVISGTATVTADLDVPGVIVPLPEPTGGGMAFPYRRPLEKRKPKKPKRPYEKYRITAKHLDALIKGEAEITPSLFLHPPLSHLEKPKPKFVPLGLKAKANSRFTAKAPRLQDAFYSDDEQDLEDALRGIMTL